MEPPSAELVRTLRELKLCGPAELRQAGGIVRVLANDLPTFDSVWIDALVQLRCLTHFQGTRLTQPSGDSLLCGSYVLTDHLGRDSWYDHYRARLLDSGSDRRLTCIDIAGLNPASVLERLESALAALQRVDQRYLHSPQQVELAGQRLISIAEPPDGRDLKELVTRRGRWTPTLVRDIASQLATGLAALERAGLCHGDVRLETVLLSPTGTARMLAPGLLVAVHPELTIHADFTPECTECLAPERVGVGSKATPQGDQYSLGCLMWHLLTGRPPYLSADPLTKVAQHQTRSIPDVRELAPDTPVELSNLIARLTARDPNDRFLNWSEVLSQLGQATRAGQHRLARLAASFDRPAMTARDWGEVWRIGKRRMRVPAMIALLVAALIWLPANRGLLLSLTGRNSDNDSPTADAGNASSKDEGGENERFAPPYSLPAPDPNGVVQLTGQGPWKTGDLSVDGLLVIRGTPDDLPVIVVGEIAWRLTADSVRLENIIIQRADGIQADNALGPMLDVAANEFDAEHCSFIDLTSTQPMVRVGGAAATATLRCSRASLVSQGPAFVTTDGLTAADFEHVLRIGNGPLIQAERQSPEPQRLHVANLTLRQAGPLCQLPAGPGNVSLQVNDSVLELSEGGAWIEFVGVGTPESWPAVIEISGEGTIASSSMLVGTRFSAEMAAAEVDEASLLIDGVFGGEYSFRGEVTLLPSDSEVTDWESDVPRQSASAPGFDAAQLIDPADRLIRTVELE